MNKQASGDDNYEAPIVFMTVGDYIRSLTCCCPRVVGSYLRKVVEVPHSREENSKDLLEWCFGAAHCNHCLVTQ